MDTDFVTVWFWELCAVFAAPTIGYSATQMFKPTLSTLRRRGGNWYSYTTMLVAFCFTYFFAYKFWNVSHTPENAPLMAAAIAFLYAAMSRFFFQIVVPRLKKPE